MEENCFAKVEVDGEELTLKFRDSDVRQRFNAEVNELGLDATPIDASQLPEETEALLNELEEVDHRALDRASDNHGGGGDYIGFLQQEGYASDEYYGI